MTIPEIPKNRLISFSAKVVAGPVLVICVVAVLFFVLFKTSYVQINLLLGNLETAKKTEGILEEKVFVLRQIQEGVLEYTNTSVTALPEKNPVAVLISQLKVFSGDSSISLSKMKSSTASTFGENIWTAQMLIETESIGETSVLISFVDSLSKTLPLLVIDNMEVGGFDEDLSLKLTISYYWSTFPTQLPRITEPIKNLVPNERVLLGELAGFLNPPFTVLEPSQFRERTNPFN